MVPISNKLETQYSVQCTVPFEADQTLAGIVPPLPGHCGKSEIEYLLLHTFHFKELKYGKSQPMYCLLKILVQKNCYITKAASLDTHKVSTTTVGEVVERGEENCKESAQKLQ